MKLAPILARSGACALGLLAAVTASAQDWTLTGNGVFGNEVFGVLNNAALRIITNNTERMRILGNGNIGIGTTTPTSALHVTSTALDPNPSVVGTQISSGIIELTRQGASGYAGYPYIDFNDGTLGEDYDARLIYSSWNNVIDRLEVRGSEFAVWSSMFVGQNYGGAGPASASNSLFVENELGVGYLADPGSYALYVNGPGWALGGWFGSDARWKRNITPIGHALDKVLQLKGVTYDFRQDEYPDLRFPQGTQMGFIAQDVEEIVPEVVITNNDGYKGVAYQNLTPLLVEAIKDQQKEIDRLRAIVERLEARQKNPDATIEHPSLGSTPEDASGLHAR